MQEIQTELVNLEIDNLKISLYKVNNIDSLYDDLISKGEDHEDVKDERIPYWAELWPSSIGLAKYLIHSYPDLKSKNILEIGCGLGLSGIAAGLLGAEVVLSDYLSDALILAERNWQLNLKTTPELILLDWRNPDPKFKADIILASDVLYEKRSHKHLIEFFKTMLNPGGYGLLSDPQRSATQEFLNSEIEGLSIEKQTTLTVQHNNTKHQIDIFKIKSTH